jgi:hypothetical protein
MVGQTKDRTRQWTQRLPAVTPHAWSLRSRHASRRRAVVSHFERSAEDACCGSELETEAHRPNKERSPEISPRGPTLEKKRRVPGEDEDSRFLLPTVEPCSKRADPVAGANAEQRPACRIASPGGMAHLNRSAEERCGGSGREIEAD